MNFLPSDFATKNSLLGMEGRTGKEGKASIYKNVYVVIIRSILEPKVSCRN